MGADGPQQRVLADRNPKPPREALSRTAAQRQTEMVDKTLQARGAARVRLYGLLVKPLAKDLPRAPYASTSEAPSRQEDPNAAAVCRQISNTAPIPAVNSRRCVAAVWTRDGDRPRSCNGDNLSAANLDMIDAETGWHQ